MHNVVNPTTHRTHMAATLYYQTVGGYGQLDFHHVSLERPDRYVSKNSGFLDGVWLVSGDAADPEALVSITFLDVAGDEAFRRELVVEFASRLDAERWLKRLDLLQSTRFHNLT